MRCPRVQIERLPRISSRLVLTINPQTDPRMTSPLCTMLSTKGYLGASIIPPEVETPGCKFRTMYGHTYCKSMDQPDKVANPARGQLNRENEYFPSAFAPENLVSRDGFGIPVPHQPAHLHNQAESGAYFRDSSRVPRWRPFMYVCMYVWSHIQQEYRSTG